VNEERWRPVVGNPLYLVSDHGRVQRVSTGRVMVPSGQRYDYIGLVYPGRSRQSRSVHSLVAEAFLGLRPVGKEVAHLDGDTRNNHWTNLAYKTPKQNSADRIAHDTHIRGERSAKKLTWDDAVAVREMRAEGRSYHQIASAFGISHVQVIRIVRWEAWQESGRRSA
jgi:hypothetical protein